MVSKNGFWVFGAMSSSMADSELQYCNDEKEGFERFWHHVYSLGGKLFSLSTKLGNGGDFPSWTRQSVFENTRQANCNLDTTCVFRYRDLVFCAVARKCCKGK